MGARPPGPRDLVLLEEDDPALRRAVEAAVGTALAWVLPAEPRAAEAAVWFCPGRPPRAPRSLPSLRWIHSGWAGVEGWFERPEWREGVRLSRTVGDFPQRIAEYVVGWLLALALDVPEALRQMEARGWRRWTPETVAGRSLLVIGHGAIGRRVAEAARGLGFATRGVRRGAPTAAERALGVESADALEGRLPEADVVVNLLPLTPETSGFWNAARFGLLAPGSVFMNVSRGATVDETALLAGLRAGRPARAILDVFREEPLPPDHPLRSAPGVWVTPHVAGTGTTEALAREFAANWTRRERGEPLANEVSRGRGY